MDFLLNPNPLPIGPVRKSNQYQYYVWQYKQKLAQEEKEEKMLQKMLVNIEEEQKKESSKNITQKKRPHHMGSFYDYNLQWKNKVQQRVKIQQMKQEQQKEKADADVMIPEKMPERREMSIFYRGPVEGWEEHFQQYLKRKTNKGSLEDEGITFHPQINSRSKKIAEKMSGKVEDRLIMFGEMQKMKQKQDQFTTRRQGPTSSSINHYNYSFTLSIDDQQSQASSQGPFNRLYKQSEELSKRRREEEMKEKHSFQPKTNKLPEEIQDRIMKKRKPLYYIKNALSQNNSLQEDSNQEVQKSKGNFKEFMQRNQILLNNRNKLMNIVRDEQIQQKQNKEKSQCTFSPNLNKNSMRISNFVKKTNKNFEEQILSNIQSQFLTEQKEFRTEYRQPINFSKVTVIDNRDDTSYDDSDSLTKMVGASSVKQTKRKYLFNEEIFKRDKQVVQEEEEDQRQEELQYEYERESEFRSQVVKEQISQKQLTLWEKRGGHTGTQDLTRALQEDSIQKMKDQQWEAELSQIENHLENMMARAMRQD